MRKFSKLLCVCFLAMSVVGCSGTKEGGASINKVEYETVTVSRPEGEKADVQFPKGEYSIVKAEGNTGIMGYWDVLKGDEVIGELDLSSSSVSSFKGRFTNMEFVDGSKDDKAYITYETDDGTKKSYNYKQDISDGVSISVNFDNEEDRKEVIDNFKFIEHVEE